MTNEKTLKKFTSSIELEEKRSNFDWNRNSKSNLTVNQNILLKNSSDRIFCQEDYAQELYNMYCCDINSIIPRGGKDVEQGQFLPITGVASVDENEIYFEVNNMMAVPVNINKEKRFFDHYGQSKSDFINWIRTPNGRKEFLDFNHLLYIEKSYPNVSGSLVEGLKNNIKNEFMEQIKNPTSAYKAKVISRNQGGFMVDVQGISAFLPGGLAAANKIVDFESYLGKTITVMVEDYLPDIDTFIFSYKKYIQHILPKLVAELDTTVLHEGFITGTSRHGIFIEFNETFTGLLHTSKMTPETKTTFEARKFHPGDQLECYILEINKNNQLVLSEFAPGSEENNDNTNSTLKQGERYSAKITGCKDFGIFIKLPTGEIGLIPSNSQNNYLHSVGEIKEVVLKNCKDGKYYFDFAK